MSKGLSEEQLAEYKAEFALFDKNGLILEKCEFSHIF